MSQRRRRRSSQKMRSVLVMGLAALAVGGAAFGVFSVNRQIVVPLVNEANEVLPFDWEAATAEEFARQLAIFTSMQPSASEGRPVLGLLWSRFLKEDEQASSPPPLLQQQLAQLFQNNQEWLRNPDGSYVHGGPEVYAERIEAIRERSTKAEPQAAAPKTFAEFKKSWIDPALPKGSVERLEKQQRRAQATADWLRQTDLKKLSQPERIALLATLADSGLKREAFGVRWSGLIAPPANGEYRFGPLLNNLVNGQYRIVINGQVVFDHERFPLHSSPGESVLLGDAIQLSVETPARILVEYRFDPATTQVEAAHQIPKTYQFPMAVLMWNSPATGLQVVPDSAYRLGTQATSSTRQGLWTEFFDRENFGVPVAQGVTSGIQEVWTQTPILPKHAPIAQALIKDSLNELFSPPTEGQESHSAAALLSAGSPLLPYLRLTDRQWVANRVLAMPKGLGEFQGMQLHAFLSQVAMLPGDTRLNLLTQWAEHHTAGSVKEVRPAGGEQLYATINHYGYALLGIALVGRHQNDLDLLMEEGLEQANGRPQTELITVAAYAFYLQNRGSEIRSWLEERLARHPSGDARAEWLIARAWMEEAFVMEGSKEVQGLPFLEQAAEIATTPSLKLDAIREMAVRETTVGQGKLALARLERALREFPAPEQQKVLQSLTANIKAMIPVVAKNRERLVANKAEISAATRRKTLNSRMERAQARGDLATAAKYQQQLENTPSVP